MTKKTPHPLVRAWHGLIGKGFENGWLGRVVAAEGEFDERSDFGARKILKAATAYRAIMRRSYDMASCPLVFEYEKGGKWVEVERGDQRFGDIVGVFARANPTEGRTALWARFHSSMLLSGEACLFTDYRLGDGVLPARGQAPKQLRVTPAGSVSPVYRSNEHRLFEDPLGFRFDGDSRPITFRPDEVLFHIYPDPLSYDRGLSPTDAADLYALVEEDLMRAVRDFVKNGLRGTIALETEDKPNDIQRKQLEAAYTRKHVGWVNRFRIWILTHGLKVKELPGVRDIDLAKTMAVFKEGQSMVYGVPLGLLSDYSDSGVRANFEEQTPMYCEGALFPDGRLLQENLTEIVCPRFVTNRLTVDPAGVLRARMDWDRVPMVQRMNLARAKVYVELVDGPVYAPNEAREEMGKEPLPNADQLNQRAPAMMPPPESAPRKHALAAIDAARATASPILRFLDDPDRMAKRLASKTSMERFEKPMTKRVEVWLRQVEERTVHRLLEGKKAAGRIVWKDENDDEGPYDEEDELEIAVELIRRFYAEVGSVRGPEATAEVGADPGAFLLDHADIVRFLEVEGYAAGKLISDTNKRLVAEALARGVADGLTVSDIAERLRDAFAIRRSQALTIARTETVRSYNFMAVEAWKQTGLVEQLEWLTAHDDAVRTFDKGDEFDHTQMDGVSVNLGTDFEVPGEKGVDLVGFPGDPKGQPGNTINCRCAARPKTKDTERDADVVLKLAPAVLEKIFANGPLTNGQAPTYKPAR